LTAIGQARRALVTRILEGAGRASSDQRLAAFENRVPAGPLGTLTSKVAAEAHAVTDGDFGAATSLGLSEDQLFEVVVCAAVGQAVRQHDAALAALAAALDAATETA
jgi:hypothetical protein